MRLVKTARRRSLFLLFMLAGACEPRSHESAPPQASSPLCSEVLRTPRAPRVVTIDDDGRLAVGPVCASPQCIAGGRKLFATRIGDVTQVELGARTFAVPAVASSLLRAGSSFPGLSISARAVAVERDGKLALELDDGTTLTAPLPTLRPRTNLGAVQAVPGGIVGFIEPLDCGAESDNSSGLITLAGAPVGRPVDDQNGAQVGAIVNDDKRLIDLAGNTIDLGGVPLGPTVSVVKLGDAWVITDKRVATTAHATVVRAGHPPQAFPHSHIVGRGSGALFAVDTKVPGAISFVDGQPFLRGSDTVDLAGVALPNDARVLRIEATTYGDRVLVIERVELASCAYADRLIIVDTKTRTAKELAADEKMRMKPIFANGKFRFLEADVDTSTP
ncbi:MAG TPA: hypothetical protein VGO62_22115 [Myxococcota bacterium]|jgi:hypothetical protein